jgi:hypothetical protein
VGRVLRRRGQVITLRPTFAAHGPKDFPGRYPRLQILTVAELLEGKKIQFPEHRVETFAKAERRYRHEQREMF